MQQCSRAITNKQWKLSVELEDWDGATADAEYTPLLMMNSLFIAPTAWIQAPERPQKTQTVPSSLTATVMRKRYQCSNAPEVLLIIERYFV